MESLLRVNDFKQIISEAKGLLEELEQEIKQQKKSPKEVDQAVINKVIKLIHIITGEDYVGVARFNKITEDIRPQCLLPHQPLKVDLPELAGLITRSMLGRDKTAGIYKNLNQARDQIINMMKDASMTNRR